MVSLSAEEKDFLSKQVLQKGITFYLQKKLKSLQKEKEKEFQHSQQLLANPASLKDGFWCQGFGQILFAEFMQKGFAVLSAFEDMQSGFSDDLTCLEKLGRFEMVENSYRRKSKVRVIRKRHQTLD